MPSVVGPDIDLATPQNPVCRRDRKCPEKLHCQIKWEREGNLTTALREAPTDDCRRTLRRDHEGFRTSHGPRQSCIDKAGQDDRDRNPFDEEPASQRLAVDPYRRLTRAI